MSDLTRYDSLVLQAFPGFEKIARQTKLVRWEEESQFALQTIRKNTRLMECEPYTVQDAIINVAAVGLTLNPAHGYAYLVPESVKVGDRREQHCHLRVSFKGLIKIATDSGCIDWIAADVVKKNDTFTFRGKWSLPEHEMDPFSADRGDSVGVYCVARMHDGQYIVEVAPWSEVLKAKNAAKTARVWDEWTDEMAKKFIIKRASKQWPKTDASDRLSKAVSVINEYEGSEALLAKLEESAAYIIEHIAEGDSDSVLEAYDELSNEEKSMLWTAKTKGGYLTQDEKRFIKDARFARYQERKESEEQGSEVEGEPSE